MTIVLGERWVPGVGDVTREDEIRREVIHILCKGPTPYSKLDKNLPEDHLEKTGLENVIRNVADFRYAFYLIWLTLDNFLTVCLGSHLEPAPAFSN